MKVLITGAAGFLGRKLTARLLQEGRLTGPSGGPEPIECLVLFSRSRPDVDTHGHPADVEIVQGDVTDAPVVRELIESGVDSIFHLAAVVSAQAETDFDLGMAVNIEGTRNLLEGCRHCARPTRFVFASSVGVYGGERVVDDRTPVTPLSSYGAQKVIGEYLVRDYHRKGFLDGRSLRLPTIIVRPGKPNKAASSFASSIIREPLTGKEAICPVSPQTSVVVLSPRRAVSAMIHGHELPVERLGTEPTIQLPATGTTAGELVEALRSIAGDRVADRVTWRPDPAIQKIVNTWPAQLVAERPRDLGFSPDESVEDIIRAFIEDELKGRVD